MTNATNNLPADLRRRVLFVLALAGLGMAVSMTFRFASYALWPVRPLSRGLARRASRLGVVVQATLDVVRETFEAHGVQA